MFSSKPKIPKGPNGEQPSFSGLPTSTPSHSQSQSQSQVQYNQQSKAMSKPPALPIDQLNLPMPDYLGGSAAGGGGSSKKSSMGYSNAATFGSGSNSHSQAQGISDSAMDMEPEVPPVWGWGYDRKKPSLMSRLFGKKVDWNESMYGYPEPQLQSQVQVKQYKPKPTTDTLGAGPPPPMMPYKMPPFQPNYPEDYDFLPRSIQKALFKENQKREKEWRRKEKEQEKLWKLSLKEWEREEKGRMKLERKMIKEQEKEALWQYRHPTQPNPAKYKYPNPNLNPKYPIRKPPTTSTTKPKTTSPERDPNNPYNFMLLPATEFGVRRPFNPMIGGNETWPNMSRTMTHAILDMNREEQLHAYHASLLHTPNW